MRKLYMMMALLLTAGSAMADKISVNEARNIAARFMNGPVMKSRADGAPLRLAKASTGYYAFNNGNGAGFVIVATDDRANSEVLGFADEGNLDSAGINDNLRWWLAEYDRQAAAAGTAKVRVSPAVRPAVAPLVTTLWNQDEPYNDLCPKYNGAVCYTGCVATAMAQIMAYHQWPLQGKGTNTYSWYVNNRFYKSLTADLSKSTYHWDAMTDSYDSNSTAEQRDAVARLMYDAGVASNMQYSTTSSGTQIVYAYNALTNNFSYDEGVSLVTRDYYTSSEWNDMIYGEIAAGRPVFYSGFTLNMAGHAFVFDGYRDGYYHINWGWGGVSNGYFLTSAYTPEVQGIGGATSGFNFNQQAIIGIQPPVAGSDAIPVVYADYFSSSRTKAGRKDDVYFGSNIVYYTNRQKTLTLGVMAIDGHNDTTYVEGNAQAVFKEYATVRNYAVNMTAFPAADGTYTIYPACKDMASGKWYRIRTNNDGTPYLTARVEGDSISFTKPGEQPLPQKAANIKISNKMYAGKARKGTLTISTGTDCYDGVRFGFVKKGASYVDVNENADEYIIVDLEAGMSKNYDFRVKAPATPGEYALVVLNGNDEIISDSIPVTVTEAPAGTPALSVTRQITIHNGDAVPLDDVWITARIKCKQGYYDGNVYAVIFEQGEQTSSNVLLTPVTIAQGESQTLTFRGTFAGIKPNQEYFVQLMYQKNGKAATLESESSGLQYNYASFVTGSTTGINSVKDDAAGVEVYTLGGQFAGRSTSGLRRGVYIVKQGQTARRIVVK